MGRESQALIRFPAISRISIELRLFGRCPGALIHPEREFRVEGSQGGKLDRYHGRMPVP
jgi:hypothetical protein